MVDTLKYTKDLQKAGLTREQAENFAKANLNLFSKSMATKEELSQLRLQMHEKFSAQEKRTDEKLLILKSQIVNRVGGIIVSSLVLLEIAKKHFTQSLLQRDVIGEESGP